MPQRAEREQILVIARDHRHPSPLAVLVAQDTTTLTFKHRAETPGLGPVNDIASTQGFRLRRGAGGEVLLRHVLGRREPRRGRPGVHLFSKAERDVTNDETWRRGESGSADGRRKIRRSLARSNRALSD